MGGMDEERKPDGGKDEPRMDLSNIRDLPPPEPRPQREIRVELLPYEEREGVSAHDRLLAAKAQRPSALQKLARTAAGFAIAALLLVGVFFALEAVDDDSTERAPWSAPSAPAVTPPPLSDQ